jgi:hypothetical protein
MTRPIIHLFLGVLFCFLSLATSAQWTKSLDKAKEAFESGNYEQASTIIAKTKKKASKKLGAQSNIVGLCLINEALINVGLGAYTDVERPLNEALAINEEQNSGDRVEYGYMLKEAANVWLLYGNFLLASDFVSKARQAFTEANVIAELESELDVMDAKILLGQGYYQQAIDKVDGYFDFFQKQIAESGQEQVDRHKKEYAEILIVKANAFRKMGDYQSSDSAFLYTLTWIDDNLGKADILYAEAKYLNAKLLQENGLAKDAQADLFGEAYAQATRKYATSHMLIMEIKKDLMNAYYATNSFGRLERINDEFKATVRQSFPDNSVHTIAEEMRTVYFYFEDQNLRILEDKINRLLSNPAIPKYHQMRADLLDFANDIALLMGEPQNTEDYQNQILEIKANLYGTDAPEYHLTKIKLANYYIDYGDKFDKVKDVYETSFNQIVEPEIREGHIMYLDILSHLISGSTI